MLLRRVLRRWFSDAEKAYAEEVPRGALERCFCKGKLGSRKWFSEMGFLEGGFPEGASSALLERVRQPRHVP